MGVNNHGFRSLLGPYVRDATCERVDKISAIALVFNTFYLSKAPFIILYRTRNALLYQSNGVLICVIFTFATNFLIIIQ